MKTFYTPLISPVSNVNHVTTQTTERNPAKKYQSLLSVVWLYIYSTRIYKFVHGLSTQC